MTVTAINANSTPAPGGSWNKTADELGRWNGGSYTQRLYRYGAGPAASAPGQRKLALGDWSVHVFDARTQPPTHVRRFYQTVWAQNLYGAGGQLHGLEVGDYLPWAGAWTAPTGTDRNIIVEWLPTVTEDGKHWTWEGCDTVETMRSLYLFAPYEPWYNGSDLFGINGQNGFYKASSVMIAASGGINVGMYSAAWVNAQERGNGTLNRMGVVLGEELLDGEAAHAQALTIASTAFAPQDSKPGIEGEDFFGPATRFEWSTESVSLRAPVTDTNPDHQTPHGYRAVLKKSVDIEERVQLALKYLRARGVTTPDTTKRAITALFVGKQDYGEIVGETSGSGMWVETDGWKGSKQAKVAWRTIGVTADTVGAFERCTTAVFGEADWEAVRAVEPGT